MNKFYLFSLIAVFIANTLLFTKSANATYVRDDQANQIILYQKDKLNFTFGGIFDGLYMRDMQDYYSNHEVLRRDNYMLLGKLKFAANYTINSYSSITGYIGTNFNYTGEKAVDFPLTIDKQYIVYSNQNLGDLSFGNVDGLYEEVALWTDVATNFGGVAHVPTFDSPTFTGLDNALTTFQYRKKIGNNFTLGGEFTTPDVSYRTGGVPNSTTYPESNFRAGMERKEAGGGSGVYDNGVFSLGAAYHYARIAHTHNQPNIQGDDVRLMKYHNRIQNIVISSKIKQGNLYYAAGFSYENVIGAWRGDSSIGNLVKRYNRYGISLATYYDFRNEDFVGFIPSIEYDFSKANQISGINESTANDTSHNGFNSPNYTFPPYNAGKDLSSNRADPFNTNKLIFSTAYYFNKNVNIYTDLALDLRPSNQINNSSTSDHIRENQFDIGCKLSF